MSPNRKSDPRKPISSKLLKEFQKVPTVVFKDEIGSDKAPKRSTLNTGLTEYSGEWSEAQVSHLLKRTLFGAKRSEIDYFLGLTPSEAVDQIVAASPLHDPPVNNYEIPGNGVSDSDVEVGETWVEAPYNNSLEGWRIQSLKGWIIDNMLHQEATLHEKMTLFWHNLLVTQFWSVFVSKASYQYYQMLQENAFGNFKELIKKLTIDPAMLFFLNGTFNRKEAPDENYSRELQELFCIGKGKNANFTESDVQEAAKVLTGWVISSGAFENSGKLTTVFYDAWHDTSDKQFSSFYGNRVISGRSGSAGAEETDELLEMIFDNNETALYICRRLYNFFVYHDIDEATETNVIEPLAELFRNSNYEILPVLKALFKSEHFFDTANRGAVIKNPADHLVGMWRSLGVDYSNFSLTNQFLSQVSLLWPMSEVGMEIGDPPSVSGWQAYYQEPSFDRFWINTDTITKRAIRQDGLFDWGHWVSEQIRIHADLPAFILPI